MVRRSRVYCTWRSHVQQSSIDSHGIRPESRFVPTLPASDTPLWGPRQNIATTFGMVKLKWFGYQRAEKFGR